METGKIQQELVLVTTTTFSRREWCKLETSETSDQTHAEQLEEACWNGLLTEMLPEMMEQTPSGKLLFLWHIRKGASFLKVELSEMPPKLEEHFSIDPAFFLPTLVYN
jgi:hypothetical protein